MMKRMVKKFKKFPQYALVSLSFLGGFLVMTEINLPALAQSNTNISIPSSDQPGAYLYRLQQDFRIQREQPYLQRPVSNKDILAPPEPEIRVEKGVLPSGQSIQGIITTPEGNVIISPSEGQSP